MRSGNWNVRKHCCTSSLRKLVKYDDLVRIQEVIWDKSE